MNRRDIELLISAKDTTGRTFKQVASSINELADTIDRQTEAAARGELSLDKLKQTQDKLGDVGRELAAIQGLIDGYAKLENTLARDEAQVADLQAKHAALTAEITQAGTATARQERDLAGYERRINSLNSTIANNRKAFADQSAALEAVGVDTANLDRAQQEIVASATRVGQGMVVARNGVREFDADLFKTTQSAIRAGEAIDLGFANKGLRFQENTRFLNAMVAEMERAEVQARESAQALANFQQIGRDAMAGAAGSRAFVPSGDAKADLDALASGLRAIIDPGRTAMQTLDGVEAAVAEAGAAASKEKARVSEYSDALNQLSEAAAAIVRQGALVDSFREQEAAVAKASAAYDKAEADVRSLAAAVASADAPSDELARSLRQAENAATSAGRALLTEETRLAELSKKLRVAKIDTDNLDAAQGRLEATARDVAAAEGKLNQTLGRQGAKPSGLFGLNPYEMQNLAFQVNDVVTSLASGQRPLQVLFQQGGQITQLFPGLVSQIVRFGVAWSGVLIPLAAVTALLAGIAGRAAEVKFFTDALNARVDGGLYDPKNLEMVSRGIQDMGVATKDAQAAVLAFVDAGLDASKLEAYSKAAVDMADALGMKVPEAAELLTGVLNGGGEAVDRLNEKTHLLTDAELVHAQALFDSGKAAEARQYVFDRAAERLDNIADKARGNWSNGVNNLRTAWSNLLGWFGKLSVFDWVEERIDRVGIAWAFLTGLIAGKSVEQAGKDAVAASRAAAGAANDQAGARQRQLTVDRQYLENLRETTTETKNLTKAERVALARRKAARDAANAGLSNAGIREAMDLAGAAEGRKADEAAAKESAKASRKAGAAQRRAAAAQRRAQNEAEAAANRIRAAQQELTNQQRSLLGRVGRGETASLEERLAGVNAGYEKIFDSIKKLRDLGITKGADGQDLAAIEAEARAAQARAVEEERLKYFEEQTNLLIKQRKDEVDAIAEAQKDGAKSTTDAFREAEAVNARMSPQIVEAAKNALEVARAIAGAKPNPEMSALIARLERIVAGENTGNPLQTLQADVGLEGLANQERELNKLIADRNGLVESYNTLQELGLISADEARQKTAQAYRDTATAITDQTAAIQRTIEMLHQQGIITDTVYNTWLAKIAAVNQQTQYTDARIAEINQTAQASIARGITSAFTTAANVIVGLTRGTMSWGDALDSVLNLGLSLLGDFLSSLAQVLVQLVALKAAQALIGGATGGFGGLFFHGGGVVGRGGSHRTRSQGAPAAAWLAAPRLHGGGGLGLGPGEYRAVLKANEEVLTEDDPRNVLNGGGLGQGPSGGQDPSLKQVLVLDPNEIPRAMQSKPGQRTILTVIRSNAETIKQMLK